MKVAEAPFPTSWGVSFLIMVVSVHIVYTFPQQTQTKAEEGSGAGMQLSG